MQHIKKIYLYLVSVITLVIWVWGSITLVNMALKTWVFPKADNYSYYPTRISPEYCTQMESEAKPLPECDPNWEENQRKAEEENRKSQRQREAAQAVSMIVIAGPLWYFHWRMARKES